MAAFEPTVLNCFLFRQTDLIPGGAVGEGTAPFELNQQRCPGKMKAGFAFRLHDEGDPTDVRRSYLKDLPALPARLL